MTIPERFLHAKHWQLFIILFGVPMLFQIGLMATIFTSIVIGGNPVASNVFGYFKFFPIIMIINIAIFFGWFWSIAIGLQAKVPENIKMNVRKFKIFFFIPATYMILFSIGMGVAFSGLGKMTENGEQPSIGLIGGMIGIILPLHFLSMFCIFYVLYFVTKTFRTAELQRETTFSDFAGEFFLIWFYPIGVWIIQPRINKLVQADSNSHLEPRAN